MTNTERLNAVFTEEFINKNKDISNVDDLYDAVTAVDSGISRESYDEYVKALSVAMHHEGNELSEIDLEDVSGGIAWTTVAGVIGLITFCYKGGQAIGEGIYYMTHR